MLPKLQEVKYQGDYRIWVQFADGTEGEIDLESELWGEVFDLLKDKTEFSKLSLHRKLKAVVRPNGADFASEFLYQKICPHYTLKLTPTDRAADLRRYGS